jgi:succinoglycan biosynthesis protein ExoA
VTDSKSGARVAVSVLVPVLNEEAHIEQALTRMRDQRFDGDVEFLFMEGGSADRTREILEAAAREDPRIRVLDNPQQATTAGLNIGLWEARGEFVARMDAHTLYPPDYLARAVDRLRLGDVAWVCGPQVPYGVGRWSSRVALALESPLGTAGSAKWPSELDRQAAGEPVEIDVEPSSGVFTGVWRRSTLEDAGGWDEGWPVNQDCELLARILASGGRVVLLPELGAEYVPADSLQGLARKYFRYGKYRAKTARRHPETMRTSHLVAPALALSMLAAVGGPRAIRPLARLGLGAYALALGVTAVRLAGAERPADAAALPAVFAAMHLGWGFGYLAGCARFGVPLEAVMLAATGNRHA